MTTVEQRQTRMDTLLNKEGFRLHSSKPALVDCDGEIICQLSGAFLKVLDSLSDAQALVTLLEMHSMYLISAERSRKIGIRIGRGEMVSTVHELLGVNRVERAAENLQESLREIAQVIRTAR